MSQAELAKRIGVGQPAISNYLHRGSEPDRDILQKMATALNVSMAWLMGFDASEQMFERIGAAAAIAAALAEDPKEGQKLFEQLVEKWNAAAKSVSGARKLLEGADDQIAEALRIINETKKAGANSYRPSRAGTAAVKAAEDARKPKG